MAVSKNKKIGTGVAVAVFISIIFSLDQDSSIDSVSSPANNSVTKSQIESTTKPVETTEPGNTASDSESSAIESAQDSTARKENTTEAEKVEVKPDPQAKPVSANTFDALIAQLKVAPEFIGGYDRSLFRHWVDDSGNGCDARREVLIEESLTPVSISSGCVISGGSWFSNFDGITTTDASSFDIDHFVPLSEAWRSGAHAWSSTTRRSFANDLGYEHSLIAVSASSNRSKGDKDPASWLPPRTSYHCEYIYKWVNVKIRWSLTVDSTEHNKIKSIASNCSIDNLNLNPPTTAPIEPKVTPTLQPQIDAAPQSTSCTDQQVGINLASMDDLMRIIHIGEARATELIQLRPYRTLDDLTRINGIAASRLNDIKNQAIACIG